MTAGRAQKPKAQKLLPSLVYDWPSYSLFLKANKMSTFILTLQSVGCTSALPSKALPQKTKGL